MYKSVQTGKFQDSGFSVFFPGSKYECICFCFGIDQDDCAFTVRLFPFVHVKSILPLPSDVVLHLVKKIYTIPSLL